MATSTQGTDGEELCAQCRTIDLETLLSAQDYHGHVQLRGYQDILQQVDCALCQLFIRALSPNADDYWQEGIYPVETCYLGRRHGASSNPKLEIWFEATSVTLPQGIWGHLTVIGEILPLEVIGNESSETHHILGRRIHESETDMTVVRGWIENCHSRHGPACERKPQEPIDIALIDVAEMRIVRSDTNERYVALSYVWGGMNTFQSTYSFLPELQLEGSLTRFADQLPRTIKDAIFFVSALGQRYLWVDSLCIVQDDADDKRHQISHMGEIYNQAELTLVAISGNDAEAGLPGAHKGPRQSQQVQVAVKGLNLVAKLPELPQVRHNSRWDTRAWTFQEQVLSRKCVFLSDIQTYFQCCSRYYAEDVVGEQSRTAPGPGSTNLIQRGTANDQDLFGFKFFMYERLVKSYSNRLMAYHSDSLSAFAGVVSSLKRSFGWNFVSGLPEDDFDLALLWRPMTSIFARPRSIRASGCMSPTWCWSAWMGNMYWDSRRWHEYALVPIFMKTNILAFVVQTDNGFHRIMRQHDRLAENRAYGDLICQVEVHLNKYDPNLNGLMIESNAPSNMYLFFHASIAGLSEFSMSSRALHTQSTSEDTKYTWLQRQRKISTQLYDNDGFQCGNLHSLEGNWASSYDPSRCEFVLLSRYNQEEITDIAIRDVLSSLPLEYPSASEYYARTFDPDHYQYKEWWALNIMLIEWRGRFARRVAIGQIHVDAWTRVQSSVKLIALA